MSAATKMGYLIALGFVVCLAMIALISLAMATNTPAPNIAPPVVTEVHCTDQCELLV
jgi:hypothetical protein